LQNPIKDRDVKEKGIASKLQQKFELYDENDKNQIIIRTPHQMYETLFYLDNN